MITTMAVSCNRPMQTSKQQLLLLAGKHTSLLRQHLFFAATSSRQGVKLVKGSFDKWSDRSTFNVVSFFLVNRLMSGLIIATTQITYGFFFQKTRMISLSVSPSHPAIMVLQKSSIVYMATLNSQSGRIAPWSDELIYGKSTDEHWSDPRQDHNSMKLAGL